jgi:hypothetical protein
MSKRKPIEINLTKHSLDRENFTIHLVKRLIDEAHNSKSLSATVIVRFPEGDGLKFCVSFVSKL